MTKTAKLIVPKSVDPKDLIDKSALATMSGRGGDWYAYQNHDLGSAQVGHIQFLQCGPTCTLKTPPARMPDTSALGIGWRYLLVGKVNLVTGAVESIA